MPAQSKAQQSAFGIALAARRGEIKPDELQGAARKLYRDKTLSDDALGEYAATKRTGLPRKVGMRHTPIRAKR